MKRITVREVYGLMNLRIIYEDEDVIVCYKPAGVPTQTAKLGMADMVSLLKNHLYKTQKEKKEPYVAVVHRLDQPVEGVLVFAKNPLAAKKLNCQMQGAGFGKYYKAVLCGEPKDAKGILEDYLVKDAKTNTSRVCLASEKEAKKARLFYEVERTYPDALDGEGKCIVKVKLDTGRHHQIRVQMANIGCPIWGDAKYGVDKAGANVDNSWKQIALCAYRLEFVHPKAKKPMVFEIEPEGRIFRDFNA